MLNPKRDETELFKDDLAKFSGNYKEFLVIVRTPSGRLLWKCTDSTWGLGATARYKAGVEEMDRAAEVQEYKDEQ